MDADGNGKIKFPVKTINSKEKKISYNRHVDIAYDT